jgi:hypothetical protein
MVASAPERRRRSTMKNQTALDASSVDPNYSPFALYIMTSASRGAAWNRRGMLDVNKSLPSRRRLCFTLTCIVSHPAPFSSCCIHDPAAIAHCTLIFKIIL